MATPRLTTISLHVLNQKRIAITLGPANLARRSSMSATWDQLLDIRGPAKRRRRWTSGAVTIQSRLVADAVPRLQRASAVRTSVKQAESYWPTGFSDCSTRSSE